MSLKPGWRTGHTLDGRVLSKTKLGAHLAAGCAEPACVVLSSGPGVPAECDLGLIDMSDIGPTLAHEVGLSLPSADGKNLLL